VSPLIVPAPVNTITKLPPSAPNMKIGLFGGSFNPAHSGHQLVSHQAIKRLGLDALWWLVSPGNPLKDNSNLPPLEQRVLDATKLICRPQVFATGFEGKRSFSYTYETLQFLTSTLRSRKFIWIMGADSFASFHHWERWKDIANLLPLAIYNRPEANFSALSSPAAIYLQKYRIGERNAIALPEFKTPAWIYLNGLKSELSSTKIRQNNTNKS